MILKIRLGYSNSPSNYQQLILGRGEVRPGKWEEFRKGISVGDRILRQ
jgi:hypothetical protein